MTYDNETLVKIFRKTNGLCHICGKKLRLFMYNCNTDKAAWEVEQSGPKADGRTDLINNLFAAHITCIREKEICTSTTARKWHGRTSAPLSKERKEQKAVNSMLGVGAAKAIIGGIVAVPPRVVFGSFIGGITGNNMNFECK